MNRRRLLKLGAALPVLTWGAARAQPSAANAGPLAAQAQSSAAQATPSTAHAPPATAWPGNLLILIELKGANDGLNTVVPFADAAYTALRPRIGIKRDEVVQLSERTGLHPALAPLLPLWQGRQMAMVEGVGYPQANLSHFRSIEIWDTASNANEYLHQGWLARAFAASPVPRSYLADGVVLGSNEMGPMAGAPRSVALANPDQFVQQSKLIGGESGAGMQTPVRHGRAPQGALQHLLKVESNIVEAAAGLNRRFAFRTAFPAGPFGNQIQTAAQIAANPAGVAAVRLTLGGFDTHQNQPGTHANLMRQLGEGVAALKSALEEIGRWNNTLVMTYSEFGRRPKENQSNGTDHGTAAPQLLFGGRVNGGLYGQPPALARLDGNGNLPHAVDFRELYATVLERWWRIPAQGSPGYQSGSHAILGGRFAPLDLVRA